MAFTIKLTRDYWKWIRRNTERVAQEGEIAALNRWATEGGFVGDETTAKMKKRDSVYRKRRQ